jgi:hypothetical protein
VGSDRRQQGDLGQSRESEDDSAPNPKKDIPWLLNKVKAEKGKAGTFSPVVFVQRLQTEGGIPLESAPKRAGTKIGVAYRAVYYFYSKAE